MNLDKLKESARRFEQREDWRKAIEVYLQAIREAEESGAEGAQDPGLYNRVGDLELKAGDSVAALRAYEQAAELYADQGFFNNAIALCGKILRVNPSRTATYLRLAQLHARKNFVGEAKKNLLEYLERMDGLGHLDEAFDAVKHFADRFSANPDIRLMLVELLRASSRTEEAKEQLEMLATELEARGDASGARMTRARLHEIEDEAASTGSGTRSSNDLVFLDLTAAVVRQDSGPGERTEVVGNAAEDLAAAEGGLLLESEELGAGSLNPEIAAGEEIGLESIPGAPESEWDLPAVEMEGLDLITSDPVTPAAEAPGEYPGLPMLDLDEGAFDFGDGLQGETPKDWFVMEGAGEAALTADSPDAIAATDFDTIDAEFVGEAVPAPTDTSPGHGVPDLVFLQVQDSLAESDPTLDLEPGAALLERVRGFLEAGNHAAGVSALEDALRLFETEGRWDEALQAAGDLVRLDSGSIGRYQKQVEIAYRTGLRTALVMAYLELGDALVRTGAVGHAVHVFERVLEHDPSNQRARSSIELLNAVGEPASDPAPAEPELPPTEAPGQYVDLGALILDDEQARDTRMRVDQRQPIEDEDEAFRESLAEFKRGIDANIDAEDFEAHYDLGLAFKGMGLLDEAIAQFQKALRAPNGRLKTSEQLGASFFERGQFAIAEAVLRRGVDGLPGADDEKIGLLYWLGRSLEAQERGREALPLYERALAVDIRFLDLGDRVQRLGEESSK